jgi:hypothetical protein
VSSHQPPTKPSSWLASQLPIFFKLLLQRYQDPSKELPASTHGLFHLLTDDRTAYCVAILAAGCCKELAAAKADFMKMEAEGIIPWSSTSWASPLSLVKKPYGDVCRLNNLTVPDTNPLPNMMDFSARVTGFKIFGKIDLRKGFF